MWFEAKDNVLLPNIDQLDLMAILISDVSRWFEAEDSVRLPGKSSGSLLPASTPDKSGEN